MDLFTDKMFLFVLLLGRVSAFLAALPIFGWQSVPVRIRAGLAILMTVLFAAILPPASIRAGDSWLAASLILVHEMLIGLGLGLAVAMVFAAVNQAAEIIRILVGMAEAETIDPLSGEESQPLGTLFEMTFAVLFLVAGGHRLMIGLLARSYHAFPIGHSMNLPAMAEALIECGSLMLVFALKLAAPLLAAFLLLMVLLAVVARVLPDVNILFESLPLRVGLGFFMAAAFLPALSAFTTEFGEWLAKFATT